MRSMSVAGNAEGRVMPDLHRREWLMARIRAARVCGRRATEAGYAMPVAMAGSLLLVLCSLSVQTASLQARWRLGSSLSLRRAEDSLASAAQQVVGELNGRYPCLLPLPLAQWTSAGEDCSDADGRAALREDEVLAVPYRLIGWQPAAPIDGVTQGAELTMEIVAGEGRPARRGAFRVALNGSPLRATEVRELGLRGVAP